MCVCARARVCVCVWVGACVHMCTYSKLPITAKIITWVCACVMLCTSLYLYTHTILHTHAYASHYLALFDVGKVHPRIQMYVDLSLSNVCRSLSPPCPPLPLCLSHTPSLCTHTSMRMRPRAKDCMHIISRINNTPTVTTCVGFRG